MGVEPTLYGFAIRCITILPPHHSHSKIGVPCRIRTCDPQLRRLLLYPAELRRHIN
jgi:uncharacterized iron-regulated protein